MSDLDDSIDEAFDKLFRELGIHDLAVTSAYKAQVKEALRKSGFKGITLDVDPFMQMMTNRQGKHLPDFDALYKYKAELDRRLMPPKPPAPQS